MAHSPPILGRSVLFRRPGAVLQSRRRYRQRPSGRRRRRRRRAESGGSAMPVRQPVFDPPFNVVRASHVELGVRDLGRSRAFYVDCLGLLVSDESKDALYLRGVEERNHHSIVLRQSRMAEVRALGFKLAGEDDLDRAAAWFARRNLPTAFPDIPYQGRTLRAADPLGMPLELYAKMEQRP